MALKIGDTVRYLNAVGGGRVVRIDGDIAYVDEDGFETPVLVRECVVVASLTTQASLPKAPSPQKNAPTKAAPPKVDIPAPTKLPVIETAGGDSINIVLGFEATDIKSLNRSSYEAYLVNDSNYYIYITVASRATDNSEWHLRYDGLIEPNIQEFLFEMEAADLTEFDRISVQYVAFKRGKDFSSKPPVAVEFKVDTTKFAKLHCFKANPYFDNPVIAFDIVSNDRTAPAIAFDAERITEGILDKQKDIKQNKPKPQSRPTQTVGDGTIEVDLHASSLFESTEGLEASDILNYQLDRFTEVMQANLSKPGTRIVFIHGKGEGVLRQALMKELTHRFKGHDVQDASFREYGFGATQVTIRRLENTPHPSYPAKKKRK